MTITVTPAALFLIGMVAGAAFTFIGIFIYATTRKGN
jgi:hypothetical protein